jgi:GNAT superfamily N-acetyltransferase
MIRATTIDDTSQLDRIRRTVFPWWVPSVAAQEKMFAYDPPDARYLRLVAEVDGVVAGFGWAGFNTSTSEAGAGSGTVTVHPDHRKSGVGKALYDRLEDHLREIGVRRAQAFALDDANTLEWMERRGWERGASARFSMVDPRELPPMPPVPEGVTLVNLGAITAEQAYELDAAMSDEPGDVPSDNWSFDDFKNRIWEDPDLDFEMSTVALVDGELACFTNVQANHATGRCWSGGTATLAQFRGRGLAKVVKSEALRKAARGGITAALTANDYSNGPMLAVNDWLGYKVIASEHSMLKTIGD